MQLALIAAEFILQVAFTERHHFTQISRDVYISIVFKIVSQSGINGVKCAVILETERIIHPLDYIYLKNVLKHSSVTNGTSFFI